MVSGLAIVLVFVLGTIGLVGWLLYADFVTRKREDAELAALEAEALPLQPGFVPGGAAMKHQPTEVVRVVQASRESQG